MSFFIDGQNKKISDATLTVQDLYQFASNWSNHYDAAISEDERAALMQSIEELAKEFTDRGAPLTGITFRLLAVAYAVEQAENRSLTTH